MALQSQLGTVNSILASTMALGVPVGAGVPILEESVTSNLALVDSVHPWVEGKSFTSNVALTQNVVHQIVNLNQNITQNLGITDAPVPNFIRPRAFTQNLGITDVLTRSFDVTANNTLNFVETFNYFNYVWDRKPASNTLNFVQTVLTLSDISVDDTLNFVQTVVVRNSTIRQSPFHFLHLTDHTSTPFRAWFSDYLALTDRARSPIYLVITQSLGLNYEGTITNIADTMNLVDSVGWGYGYDFEQELGITDSQHLTGIWLRPVAQDLDLGHALAYYEVSPCIKKQYTPFQGDSTVNGAVTPPSLTLPVQQTDAVTDRFLLFSPASGPITTSVSLRAPEMDNRDRNAYTRVTRETRGGELVVFADPTWPHIRTMVVTIIGLLKTEVDELQTFLLSTVGQVIGIQDWEGRIWSGFITNPNEPATDDGKEKWTVTFEFEGELQESHNPRDQGLNLTQSVAYSIA